MLGIYVPTPVLERSGAFCRLSGFKPPQGQTCDATHCVEVSLGKPSALQNVVNATLDMLPDHGLRAFNIALQCKLEEKLVIVDDWLSTKAAGEQVITQETVKNRRKNSHQRGGVAGRHDRLVELPVV